ncbi:MAG: CaiB/BaiF CoA-transferase family protein [Desulfobulbus oligotrophicus]|jgi:crotonobetainyl-CoA:carnitine CoA-transferase CaiB-like acyl-CoA transferase|nr:CaiB/BaiF CoA-transferase family protein [Desulfobulbus oligotrophicus]
MSDHNSDAVVQSLPLSGIRVLELGHNIMGPACGLILADLGAEVYKIERPGKGDDTRWLEGFGAGFFTCFNRNKKSLGIDLKQERGKELLLRLVEQVDVLIENFAPGTVERLGIGSEVCRLRNPQLIFCSLKGFMPGPYAHRLALDEVVQMMGGLAYMTGPNGKPMRAGASVTDILSGSFGVIGILTALLERRRTGRGQEVQATLFESVAFLMAQHMAGAGVTGDAPPPMPEREKTWAVYELFGTSDGHQVFIGITSDRHWQRFCEVFGFSDWAEDPRLATNEGRVAAGLWFFTELKRRLLQLTKNELITMAEQAQIPFAPVNQPIDLWDDPHLNQSHGLVSTTTMTGDVVRLPKLPLRLQGHSFPLRIQPPSVGQGGGDLLSLIRLTADEMDELATAGIVDFLPSPPRHE